MIGEAVHADPVSERLDDTRAHDPNGRLFGAPARRSEHLPQALGLTTETVSSSKKSGTIDFKAWYREPHGEPTPWGDEDSDAFVTAAESALEREISRELMAGKMALQDRRTLESGETLVEQGAPGDELYLVLDGVLAVEIDGEEVAEIGPGAGRRREGVARGRHANGDSPGAQTRCRVAVIPGDLIDRQELEDLAAKRRPFGL